MKNNRKVNVSTESCFLNEACPQRAMLYKKEIHKPHGYLNAEKRSQISRYQFCNAYLKNSDDIIDNSLNI